MNIRRFSSREERLAGLTPLHGGGGGPILYSEHGIHYQSLTQGHTLVLGRSGPEKPHLSHRRRCAGNWLPADLW